MRMEPILEWGAGGARRDALMRLLSGPVRSSHVGRLERLSTPEYHEIARADPGSSPQ